MHWVSTICDAYAKMLFNVQTEVRYIFPPHFIRCRAGGVRCHILLVVWELHKDPQIVKRSPDPPPQKHALLSSCRLWSPLVSKAPWLGCAPCSIRTHKKILIPACSIAISPKTFHLFLHQSNIQPLATKSRTTDETILICDLHLLTPLY